MGKANILIVEDEAIIAQDLKWQLEGEGYTVPVVLDSGEEAAKQVLTHNIDLVLMDIVLKGKMDGIAAAREIHLKSDIPVIYVSAYTDQEIMERAKISEPSGYIVKPVKKRDLIITIDIALYKYREGKDRTRAERQWGSIFDAIPELILIMDRQHRIVRANRAVEEKLGVKRNELIGKLCYEVIHGTDKPPEHCPYRKVLQDGKEHIEELYAESLKGHYILSATPLFDLKGNIERIVEVAQDITDRKAMEDEMKNMSITDDLTGLHNRRGFFSLLEQQLKLIKRQKEKVYLLYADIDNLKEINDRIGHSKGDLAIIDAANIFKSTFRESDIIARLGGDEFAVFPIADKATDIDLVLARLQGKIDDYNEQEDRGYVLSVSIGIASCDSEHFRSADELLAEADRLMYERKNQKKKT